MTKTPDIDAGMSTAFVDRCICHDLPFVNAVDMARSAHGHDVEAGLAHLRERFGCGTGCGLCVPFLRRALRTGEVRVRLSDGEG